MAIEIVDLPTQNGDFLWKMVIYSGFSYKMVIFHGKRYPLVMTNSLPWKITFFLVGKPSISMDHFQWLCKNNQRVWNNDWLVN